LSVLGTALSTKIVTSFQKVGNTQRFPSCHFLHLILTTFFSTVKRHYVLITCDYTVLVVNEPDLEECCDKNSFVAIDTSTLAEVAKKQVAISISLDLLKSVSIGNETVRVASSFYNNISQVLNFGLPEK